VEIEVSIPFFFSFASWQGVLLLASRLGVLLFALLGKGQDFACRRPSFGLAQKKAKCVSVGFAP